MLDMLWSFAHVSICMSKISLRRSSLIGFSVKNYGNSPPLKPPSTFNLPSLVRPEFTGTLAIKSGRHPILENVQSVGMVVPNDVYCSDCTAFQMLQGPK